MKNLAPAGKFILSVQFLAAKWLCKKKLRWRVEVCSASGKAKKNAGGLEQNWCVKTCELHSEPLVPGVLRGPEHPWDQGVARQVD